MIAPGLGEAIGTAGGDDTHYLVLSFGSFHRPVGIAARRNMITVDSIELVLNSVN